MAYAQAEKAAATRKAYASDWRDFSRWCGARLAATLPAHPASSPATSRTWRSKAARPAPSAAGQPRSATTTSWPAMSRRPTGRASRSCCAGSGGRSARRGQEGARDRGRLMQMVPVPGQHDRPRDRRPSCRARGRGAGLFVGEVPRPFCHVATVLNPPGREASDPWLQSFRPKFGDYRVGRCRGGLKLGACTEGCLGPTATGRQTTPSWRPAPYRDASSWSRSVSLTKSRSVSLTVSIPRYLPRRSVSIGDTGPACGFWR